MLVFGAKCAQICAFAPLAILSTAYLFFDRLNRLILNFVRYVVSLLVRFTHIQENSVALYFRMRFKACFMFSNQRNELLISVQLDIFVIAQEVRKGRGRVRAVVDHVVHSINQSCITEPLCLEPLNQYLEELRRQSWERSFYFCRISDQLFLA